MREVVIEQLIRARPFTFIRLIDTDETEDVFVLLFRILPLNFSPQGKPPIGSEINVTWSCAIFRIFLGRFFTLNGIED